MRALPLLGSQAPSGVFAHRSGRCIGVAEFLREAAALSARLPARAYVLNLCADRYGFTVGFAAALLRRQVSLLPPNHTPDLVARLCKDFPDIYCLTDDSSARAPVAGLEMVRFAAPSAATSSSSERMTIPDIPSQQTAVIAFTSGSTGEPVPYEKSWRTLVASVRAELARLGLDNAGDMSLLGTVPPQHMYGLESTVMLALQGGLAMHAGKPFYPADICSALDELPRPRTLVTTPFHLRALLADVATPPPVDLIVCATAHLPRTLAVEAEARFDAPLHEVYGCTEAGQIATRRPASGELWRPLPGISLHGNDALTWVQGADMRAAYLLNDIIERTPAGDFHLLGRKSDLINIAGKRTSLAHLNHHLNAIDGVRDGVFVVPAEDDEARSTRLTAYVVATPGVEAKAILCALRQRIDAAFLPRPLHLVSALPRNTTGKLPQHALECMVPISSHVILDIDDIYKILSA